MVERLHGIEFRFLVRRERAFAVLVQQFIQTLDSGRRRSERENFFRSGAARKKMEYILDYPHLPSGWLPQGSLDKFDQALTFGFCFRGEFIRNLDGQLHQSLVYLTRCDGSIPNNLSSFVFFLSSEPIGRNRRAFVCHGTLGPHFSDNFWKYFWMRPR